MVRSAVAELTNCNKRNRLKNIENKLLMQENDLRTRRDSHTVGLVCVCDDDDHPLVIYGCFHLTCSRLIQIL